MSDFRPTAWLSDYRPDGGSTDRPTHVAPQQAPTADELHRQQQSLLQHHNDVAGVLRRNQACLACRRRKLKCDAIRPHCSTCVRSHKHLMRTAPRSNPVLFCDYDDGAGATSANNAHVRESAPASPTEQDDEAEASRKKRKSSGSEPKRKKDTEAEKLKKRIEELEARLTHNQASVQDQMASTASTSRLVHSSHPAGSMAPPSAVRSSDPVTAESPTAFLDILSAAATSHAPPQHPQHGGSAGLRAGVTGSAMMNGATGTTMPPAANQQYPAYPQQGSGMTPNFTFGDLQQESLDMRPAPVAHHSGDSAMSGSLPSPRGNTGISPYHQSSGSTLSESIPLTPSGIFNFSPGPPEPVDYESMPAADVNGKIQPSSRLEGPWRGIETVDSFVAAGQARAASQYASVPPPNIGPPAPHISMMNPPFERPTLLHTDLAQPQSTESIHMPFEEDIQQQLLMDLFWPGWPPGLPEPHIVNELIELFFDLVPSLPRMMLRSRFQTRMTLPPTHSNFPHPALLHAVCAITSNYCSPSVYAGSTVARSLNGKGNPTLPFSTWQAGLAKEAVSDGLNTGNRMFDVLRGMMVLSRLFIDDTRMLECWAYHGLVARMILPLGLNVRSAELSLKSVMLPPPADAIEREERRAAVWFALYHDTISSLASGWGTSMGLDEMTVALPVSLHDFEYGGKDMAPNPQDMESSDLFTHHPVADPFVLCLKTSILTHRVTKFARKWKNRHLRDDDDLDGMQRPEFRELANGLACFQMSFPYELRNPCRLDHKKRLDIDLIVAHMLPHAALICLYEPFADITDSSDAPARRVMASAQAIVGVVQQLAAIMTEGSKDFALVMHSAASVCLVTAARTCLLFYRHALNVNDERLATSLRSDIEMIRMALEQFGLRFKIGHHHAQLVAYFLDRATNPTYDKLAAHYPDHPRPGAPVLHPQANLGVCVANALNIKRGYWRVTKHFGQAASRAQVFSAGPSPFDSTPGSSGNMPNGHGARICSDSPQAHMNGQSRTASLSGNSGTGHGEDTAAVREIAEFERTTGMGAWGLGPSNKAGTGGESKGNLGTGSRAEVAEGDVSFLLPNFGANPIPSAPDKAAKDGWLNLDTWLDTTAIVDNVQPDDAAAKPNTTNSGRSPPAPGADWGIHDPYRVHADGTRHIFGHAAPDQSSGIGPTLTLPSDAPLAGKGAGGRKSGEGQEPLLAETAAWFMGPENARAKGAPEPTLGAAFAGFRGPRD